jgi:DNA polymerase-3 subunit chi
LPAGSPDVLISLGARVSPAFEKFTRVAEFLDARPEVRAAGRERFKAYRDKAIEPTTHKV